MSEDKREEDSKVEGSADQSKKAVSEAGTQGFGILAARFLKKTAPATITGEHPTLANGDIPTIDAKPGAPAAPTGSLIALVDDDDVIILDDDIDDPVPSSQKETGEIPKPEIGKPELADSPELGEEKEDIDAEPGLEDTRLEWHDPIIEEDLPKAISANEEIEQGEPAEQPEEVESSSYEVIPERDEEVAEPVSGQDQEVGEEFAEPISAQDQEDGEEIAQPISAQDQEVGEDFAEPISAQDQEDGEEIAQPISSQDQEIQSYAPEESTPLQYSDEDVSAGQEQQREDAEPADEAPEANPTDLTGYSQADLESIGAGGFSKNTLDAIESTSSGYSKSELDSIGTSGSFDKSDLDSIGTSPSFPKSELDSIGTSSTFEKSDLDPSSSFAKSELDSIGTSGSFAKSELDSIGTATPAKSAPSAPEAKSTEAPAKTGLLGGSFGRKAKSFTDKRAGQIKATSAAIEQRDTPKKLELQNQFTPLAKETAPEPLLETPTEPVEPEALVEPLTEPGADALDEPLTEPGLEALAEPLTEAGADALDEPLSEAAPEPTVSPSRPPASALTLPASFSPSKPAEQLEPKEELASPTSEPGRLLADADVAFQQRQYAAAEPIYARALTILERAGADHDPLLIGCLDKAGDNLFELRKYKEALPLYRKLIILHEKLSSSDRDLISAMYKIAKTSEKLNLTTEADSMYKRAFRLGQQSLVPGDPLLANVLEGYGNMLMRSEGADAGAEPAAPEAPPPTPAYSAAQLIDIPTPRVVADGRSAGVQSILSPEEIALLNRLEVKGDETSKQPVAMPPPATPATPVRAAAAESVASQMDTTGKRATLREVEDKVKYRPPSTGGAPPGSANMAIRLILFLLLAFGFVQYAFNAVHMNVSKPKPVEIKVIPGKYTGNTYKALDGLTVFTIWTDNRAYKEFLSSKIAYDYKPWNGQFADDMEMFSGKIRDKDIGFLVEEGYKDPDGNLLYRLDAPENDVVISMRDVGAKVQAYYKSHGKYPEGADLAKAAKITYKNPFVGGPETVTTHSIKWPKNLNAKQIFLMSPFDINLENGGAWEGESGNQRGEISALSSHTVSPAASVCYVHGRDRHGEFLKRSDGKVLLLVYKNGLDVTPVAALPVVKDKTVVPLRVTSNPIAPNFLTIILGYLVILGLFVGTIFLAIKSVARWRKKGYATRPPIILPFATCWTFVLFLLCLTPKFAPDIPLPVVNKSVAEMATMATLPVFMLGIVFMLVYMQVTKPKPRKPGT